MPIDFQFHGPEFSRVIIFPFLMTEHLMLSIPFGIKEKNATILILLIILVSMNFYNLILNSEGTGKVNWKGVAYYNKLINYLLKRGNFLWSL